MEHIIIVCKRCGCKLGLPSNKGMLKVTCPKCKYEFQFDSGSKTTGTKAGSQNSNVTHGRGTQTPTSICNSPQTQEIIKVVVQQFNAARNKHTPSWSTSWEGFFFRADGIYFQEASYAPPYLPIEHCIWRYQTPLKTDRDRQQLIDMCADAIRRDYKHFDFVEMETDFESILWRSKR